MPHTSRPPIYVTEAEQERLSDLAHAALNREPAAVTLIEELSRAMIMPLEDFPDGVVRMHDSVSFLYDGADYDRFTLVYPFEANIAAKRISILTQVGAALIGLRVGDAMKWKGPDGKDHALEVLDVSRS